MGWGSGSGIASEIEEALAPYMDRFSVEEIRSLGRNIAGIFRGEDCDTLEECDGFIGDGVTFLDAERDHAPAEPVEGDTYKSCWGETRRFNGKRWVYHDDEG